MDIKRVERIERNKYKRKIKRYRKFGRLKLRTREMAH